MLTFPVLFTLCVTLSLASDNFGNIPLFRGGVARDSDELQLRKLRERGRRPGVVGVKLTVRSRWPFAGGWVQISDGDSLLRLLNHGGVPHSFVLQFSGQ